MTLDRPLIPRPRARTEQAGEVAITSRTRIETADASLDGVARWLRQRLRLDAVSDLVGAPVAEAIVLRRESALAAEDYILDTTGDSVTVAGADSAGVWNGAQTLVQLFPADVLRAAPLGRVTRVLPRVRIADAPEYPRRGVMLDVARHFLPKREVLRLIDLIAAYKFNVLHLHLTDDQGWRVEIKRYPRLTEVGSWRTGSQQGWRDPDRVHERPHGGFYTQDDLREIVAYAADRHVEIVPEIDGPGHVQAAVAAYPELGTPSEAVPVWRHWGIASVLMKANAASADFFRDVLDEVMDIFPGPYIGIGADEVFLQPWLDDPDTDAGLAEIGLSDVSRYPHWFVAQMEAHVARRGRRLFGWDEVLEGPPSDPRTLVAAWRGDQGIARAAEAGFDVVACPNTSAYLDYRQSDDPDEPSPGGALVDLETAYALTPRPAGMAPEHARHVLGGQANLWTETVDSARMVDYYLFPRLLAVSEALWSGGGDYPGFLERLPSHEERLEALGVEYRRSDGPRPWQTRPDAPGAPRTPEEMEQAIGALFADPLTGRGGAG
ncbi:beta-N-acetylhexosaminidase [Microbacterium sp. 2MCAF23]|uniref:beta-N-acetylhexosaminidase n=1 Tax=Microbacterium sp. 2MCAF23 TaxID=3232985 RepID=UPI003F97B8A7